MTLWHRVTALKCVCVTQKEVLHIDISCEHLTKKVNGQFFVQDGILLTKSTYDPHSI